MKRIHGLAAAALLGAAALFSFGPPAEAATPPEVTSVTEVRDVLGDRLLLVLEGKRLTKFISFNLFSMEAGPAMVQVLSRKGTRVVLGAPGGTPPGDYFLDGALRTGEVLSFPITIRNGVTTWSGITGIPTDIADGDGGSLWTASGADVVRPTGRVGVGVDSPTATIHAAGSEGLLYTGVGGPTSVPASGGGTRMMFVPAYGAFRAGNIGDTQWDEANLGNLSVAFGGNTIASGSCTLAAGIATTASGNNSVALCYVTTASGGDSFAAGNTTTASGQISAAFGFGSTASGDYSTAFGQATTAQAQGSVALGRYNVVEGDPDSLVSDDPVLVVGNGNALTASNAFTLRRDGNLTIAGSLTETSDARLKTEIAPLSGVLSRLERVRGVSYRFKDAGSLPSGRRIGLLAQEVRAAFPELVTEDAQGRLGVAYGDFTAVLLEAIREQEASIAAREKEAAGLRAELDAVRARLERIEKALEAASTPR